MEEQIAQSQEMGKRFLEYVSKSPIITLWNLILFLGGILLLIYFWRISYLPQADLASLSGVFAAAALVGVVLLFVLVVSQILPGLYFQFAIKLKTREDEASARKQFFFCYVFGAIVFDGVILLIDGLKFELWAIALIGASVIGGCGGWKLLERQIKNYEQGSQSQDQREESGGIKWDEVILCALTWSASLLFSVFPLAFLHGSDTDIAVGVAWLFWVVILNFIFAGLKPDSTAKAAMAVLVAAFFFLIVTMITPSRISSGIVRSLGLGNISNATLLVTAKACKALDQIDGALCKVNNQGDMGLISQVDIVSRIGGEYLLEFRYPKKCPKSCDTSSDETSRVLRTTLKGDDVLSYSVDRPAKQDDSSNKAESGEENKGYRSAHESSIEPLSAYPHATLPPRSSLDSFTCKYAEMPCGNQPAIPERITPTAVISTEKSLSPYGVQPIINNYIDGCCSCKQSGGVPRRHTEKPCVPSKRDAEK